MINFKADFKQFAKAARIANRRLDQLASFHRKAGEGVAVVSARKPLPWQTHITNKKKRPAHGKLIANVLKKRTGKDPWAYGLKHYDSQIKRVMAIAYTRFSKHLWNTGKADIAALKEALVECAWLVTDGAKEFVLSGGYGGNTEIVQRRKKALREKNYIPDESFIYGIWSGRFINGFKARWKPFTRVKVKAK